MRVLFVYTNINGFHADSFGDGISQIMAVTKKAGHEIQQIQILYKKEYGDLERMVKEFKPEVVGYTAVSSQWGFVAELSENIKKISPKTVQVCGGVHTTLNPQSILETDGLDCVFVGDSEYPFLDFLKKVENKESWKDCDNIAFNDGGTMKKNKLRPLLSNEELEKLPHPDRTTYPYSKVLHNVGLAPFHFTRGCPFTCTYCSNIGIAKVYGHARYNIRQASPEYAIRELEEVIKNNPTIGPVYKISLTDDIFGLNKKWRKEFLKLYRVRIKIPFICLLRCDVATEDTLEDLARGYCDKIQFGVESGNEYIRNTVMDRSMKRETIINAFKLSKKFGLKTNAINIIGVPGETKEMLLETIKLNQEIDPTTSGVNIFYPYKGTPLGDKCFKEGLVNVEKYKDFSNERRESVMNYSEEWLETLKYYRENWYRHVFPRSDIKNIKRTAGDFYFIFKQQVKKIPVVGPIATDGWRAAKRGVSMGLNRGTHVAVPSYRKGEEPTINHFM